MFTIRKVAPNTDGQQQHSQSTSSRDTGEGKFGSQVKSAMPPTPHPLERRNQNKKSGSMSELGVLLILILWFLREGKDTRFLQPFNSWLAVPGNYFFFQKNVRKSPCNINEKVMINHVSQPSPNPQVSSKTKRSNHVEWETPPHLKGPLGHLLGRIFKIMSSQLSKHTASTVRHRKNRLHAGNCLAAFDFLVLNTQGR